MRRWAGRDIWRLSLVLRTMTGAPSAPPSTTAELCADIGSRLPVVLRRVDAEAAGWVESAVRAQRLRGERAVVFRRAALLSIAIDAWRMDALLPEESGLRDDPQVSSPRAEARLHRRVLARMRRDPVVTDLRVRARLRFALDAEPVSASQNRPRCSRITRASRSAPPP